MAKQKRYEKQEEQPVKPETDTPNNAIGRIEVVVPEVPVKPEPVPEVVNDRIG